MKTIRGQRAKQRSLRHTIRILPGVACRSLARLALRPIRCADGDRPDRPLGATTVNRIADFCIRLAFAQILTSQGLLHGVCLAKAAEPIFVFGITGSVPGVHQRRRLTMNTLQTIRRGLASADSACCRRPREYGPCCWVWSTPSASTTRRCGSARGGRKGGCAYHGARGEIDGAVLDNGGNGYRLPHVQDRFHQNYQRRRPSARHRSHGNRFQGGRALRGRGESSTPEQTSQRKTQTLHLVLPRRPDRVAGVGVVSWSQEAQAAARWPQIGDLAFSPT